MTNTPICVLGMHRSGTSCLTGLLEDAGVALGNVSKCNPHNLKGNQENRRIMHLHDAVLADAGASWYHPPAEPLRWQPARLVGLAEILADYHDDRAWAFKDPRTVFTLPGWLSALPQLRFVGTFRHPLAVARSLQRRSEMPLAEGLELWRCYNAQILRWHERFGFPLVDFDLPDDEYLRGVQKAMAALKLILPRTGLHFFDPSLRNRLVEIDTDLPPAVAALYRRLRVLSE